MFRKPYLIVFISLIVHFIPNLLILPVFCDDILVGGGAGQSEQKQFHEKALPIVIDDSVVDITDDSLEIQPLLGDSDYESPEVTHLETSVPANLETATTEVDHLQNESTKEKEEDEEVTEENEDVTPIIFQCQVSIPKVGQRTCLTPEYYILPTKGEADFRGCVNIERSSRIEIGAQAKLFTDDDTYVHIGKQSRVIVQGDVDVTDQGVLMFLMCNNDHGLLDETLYYLRAILEPSSYLQVSGEAITEGGDPRNLKSMVLYPKSHMAVHGKLRQKFGSSVTAYNNATLQIEKGGSVVLLEGVKLTIVNDARLIVSGSLVVSPGNIIDMQGFPDTVNISGSLEIVTDHCPSMQFKLTQMFISGSLTWKSCGLFKFYVSTVIVTGSVTALNGPNEEPGYIELSSSRMIVVGNLTVTGGTLVVFDGELLVIGELSIEEGGSMDVMLRCTVLGSVRIGKGERLVLNQEGSYANNAIECEK